MAATAEQETDETPKKKGMIVPLMIGLVLAAAAGGGGYVAATSGMLSGLVGGGGDSYGEEDGEEEIRFVPVAFVPLETLTISLGEETSGRHLIFSAQLEVDPDYLREVETLTPRVLDVLNSYLRIVNIRELSEPTSLARLRSQMLRRIQVVTGEGRVRDLLITQFVVN